MAWLQNKWMGWIGSGALLGLAFLIESLWWVGFIGAAWFLAQAATSARLRTSLIGGWCAWFIKALAAVGWFWYVYPVEWLGYDLGPEQLGFLVFCWVMSAIGLAFGGVVVAGCVWASVQHNRARSFLFLLVPFVWVGAEFFGALAFSLISLGEGGIVTGAFSFGMTGYLLAAHPWIILLASWFGVYGLSALFASLAFCLWRSFEHRSMWLALIFALVLGVSAVVPVSSPDPAGPTVRVVSIDTQFPVAFAAMAENDEFVRSELTRALRIALLTEPEYVLLPEDSGLFPTPVRQRTVANFVQEEFGSTTATIVDSRDVSVNGVRVLRSHIYEGTTERLFVADKQYLVPQGEFLPAFSSRLLDWLGYDAFVDRIGQNIAFRPGPIASQRDFPEEIPAILFCFESVDPLGVRRLLKERPNVPFIAHPISHAWFHTPHVLWFNLDRMVRVQALWNDIPIVSAGSHVAGKVYRANGLVVVPELIERAEYWTVRQTELER